MNKGLQIFSLHLTSKIMGLALPYTNTALPWNSSKQTHLRKEKNHLGGAHGRNEWFYLKQNYSSLDILCISKQDMPIHSSKISLICFLRQIAFEILNAKDKYFTMAKVI